MLQLTPTLYCLQVKEELTNQIVRYTELIGDKPVYIDGHQHVHMLPGRECTLSDMKSLVHTLSDMKSLVYTLSDMKSLVYTLPDMKSRIYIYDLSDLKSLSLSLSLYLSIYIQLVRHEILFLHFV